MAKEKTNTLAEEVEVASPASTNTTQVIVQNVNPGLAKQRADNDRIQKLNKEFIAKIKAEPMVTFKPPKFYADRLSPIYAISVNNLDVIVRFDDTPQKFPQSVYNYLMKKLARILASASMDDRIDEL